MKLSHGEAGECCDGALAHSDHFVIQSDFYSGPRFTISNQDSFGAVVVLLLS